MHVRSRRLLRLGSAVLVLAVILSGLILPESQAAPDPLSFLMGLEPLRKAETFPFTRAEYQQVLGGETYFKGREVPGTPLLEGGVAKVMDVPAWKVWRAIVDEWHYDQYLPQLKFATVIAGAGQGRMIFDFLEIPLISDRQWVVEARHWGELWQQSGGKIWHATFKNPANQAALIETALKNGKIPASIAELQGDTVTLKESRASYTVIELPDGRCLAEYRAFSDPAGKIPASLLNYGAPSTARKVLEAHEKRAKSADSHFSAAGHPPIYDPAGRVMGNSRPTP